MMDPDKSDFLTYMPAHWAKFVAQAAEETELNVFVGEGDQNQVAVYTTEFVSLTPFWARFRELRDG